MKNIITTIILLFVATTSYSQQTTQFKESQYLKLNSCNYFVTVIGDTVRLKIKKTNGFKFKPTGISISQGDTVIHQSQSEKYKYVDFLATDFGLDKQKRLYGDFVQDKKIIKFYPWRFTESSLIESKLEKNNHYIIEIPNRVVLKTAYSAWQYGALTLPAKFYTKTIDSLSNTQFNANFNLIFGRKWGNKKYSYLVEKENAYSIAKSINLIAGIGELTLSSTNTENSLTKEIKVASLSYGLAFGFQYKKIGIFIASGLDTPLSKYGKNWVYKENIWLGFGLGLGL
jgi:hypothetical protein